MKKTLIALLCCTCILTGCAADSLEQTAPDETQEPVANLETALSKEPSVQVSTNATTAPIATEAAPTVSDAHEVTKLEEHTRPTAAPEQPIVTEPLQPVTADTLPETIAPVTEPEKPTEPATTTPPHTHSYEVTLYTTATCTIPGALVYTCSCGDSYQEPIPAAHDWVASTTAEEGHWGNTVCICRCGWSGSGQSQGAAMEQYFSHVESIGYGEERDNHSYDCVGENWIVDTPAQTIWNCTKCGAVSQTQP